MKIADFAPEYAASLTEGKQDDIENLQPDTVLAVFHGSDAGTAAQMVSNGIDGRQRIHRHYPHTVKIDDGKPVLINRGLFVGPNLKDAAKFGHVVVKFKVQARRLHHIWPVGDKVRQDDAFWRKYFPNSFRPSVSAYLSGRAWESEPQALFRGLVSPRAIERVYLSAQLYGQDFPDHPRVATPGGPEMIALSPEEFLTWSDQEREDKGQRVAVEPQERLTAEQYQERICQKVGCSPEILNDVLRRFLSRAKCYDEQIRVVMAPGSGGSGWDKPLVPYSAAKRVLPRLLSHLGIEPAANRRREPERYYGF